MTGTRRTFVGLLGALLRRVLVLLGAAGLTLAFFLVLPLLQTYTAPPPNDLLLQTVDTAQLEAPPPPPPPEPEKEPEREEEPPQLEERTPPLDLSQLELALNPTGLSDRWLGGDFAVQLNTVTAHEKSVDAIFSLADLDQKPRVIYQPGPLVSKEIRRHAPGTVYVIFIVDVQGRVENPVVQKSSDPVFERPALNAVKQWKFEPGKRNGQTVRFRMRVPITFPKE